MANIVVIGAGIGGLPAVFDLRHALGSAHTITLISATDHFQFTPSNPWVAVGWRTAAKVTVPLAPVLAKKKIQLCLQAARQIDAEQQRITLADGSVVAYDYLVIATGPELAFDEIPGLGPEAYTHSVCTTPHAVHAWEGYQQFLENPGPIVVGGVQGVSCFGPMYEFALILDADLRKRKIRDRVPMTLVTSEPYIGHMGLGGVGDSKGLLETELRKRHIKWITNAKVASVTAGQVNVIEHGNAGEPLAEHAVPSRYTMLIPAFRGVPAVAEVEGLCNARGFVQIDEFQRNPRYPNIYAVGVCVAIAPSEPTPVPTGVPKTGYMIESMVTAAVGNIALALQGQAPNHRATWNAICLADMGDDGIAFVALPQIPPRNVTWARRGRWVHLAKVAFEKYFIGKMRSGNTEPLFEKHILRVLGIERLRT